MPVACQFLATPSTSSTGKKVFPLVHITLLEAPVALSPQVVRAGDDQRRNEDEYGDDDHVLRPPMEFRRRWAVVGRVPDEI
jgi:hypothetical protein